MQNVSEQHFDQSYLTTFQNDRMMFIYELFRTKNRFMQLPIFS